MTEHTPAPWYWEKDLYESREGVILGANMTICRVARTNQESNAAYIVRACNNFDAMLEALKAIHSWGHINGKLPKVLCERLKTTIAAVEKEGAP